jgi:hypothetical protein
MTFKEVLDPAIDYAEKGFAITEEIASRWIPPNALPLRGCCTQLDPDSINTFYIKRCCPSSRHDLYESRIGEDVSANPAGRS